MMLSVITHRPRPFTSSFLFVVVLHKPGEEFPIGNISARTTLLSAAWVGGWVSEWVPFIN
uniref:Unclassified n=1 Tax=Fusarium clavum TaxID=2594811 RepID=W1ID05_9HYPO|nr:unclassified [Fusarium clavum]CEF82625.1 unclassified [Fusarium clavum]